MTTFHTLEHHEKYIVSLRSTSNISTFINSKIKHSLPCQHSLHMKSNAEVILVTKIKIRTVIGS